LEKGQTLFLNWNKFPHAPYSLDKGPLGFALFRSLAHDLDGQNFANIDEVTEFLVNWFASKETSFYEKCHRYIAFNLAENNCS
jgi:hypothetical protein